MFGGRLIKDRVFHDTTPTDTRMKWVKKMTIDIGSGACSQEQLGKKPLRTITALINILLVEHDTCVVEKHDFDSLEETVTTV